VTKSGVKAQMKTNHEVVEYKKTFKSHSTLIGLFIM